ncbi:hypothetical protein BDK51DRAFT_31484, partial [Blyttiomyces helicus]
DLCILLLLWIEPGEGSSDHEALRPEETFDNRKLVSDMLNTLAANCVHSSKATINNNLKIIRSFVENWGYLITPPKDTITKLFKANSSGKENNQILSAIFLVSIFVVNSISPSGDYTTIEADLAFYGLLISKLTHKFKEIFAPAAEVVGHVLRFYRDKMPNRLEAIEKSVQSQTKGVDIDRFVLVMNRISLSYPDILTNGADLGTAKKHSDPEITKYRRAKDMLFVIPSLSSTSKSKCLEALSSVAKDVPNFFEEAKAKSLLQLLNHREEDCQTFVLLILLALAPQLTFAQIQSAFKDKDAIQKFFGHPSAKCRRAFYAVIVELYKRLSEIEEDTSHFRAIFKNAILKGLTDSDEQIRRVLIEYLHKDGDVANLDIFGRTQGILGSLYAPDAEPSFLNYATYLLLEATKEAPGYSSLLFNSPLPDSHFSEAKKIDGSGMRNDSMLPLFAATQASQENLSSSQMMEGVRRTQEPQWNPTLAADPRQARSLFSITQSEISGTLISLPSGSQGSAHAGRPARSSIYELKRRSFRSDGKDDNVRYARRAEQVKRQQAVAERQKQSGAQTVELRRLYREGELPDIQIKLGELVDPLQALCQRDVDVARHIFSCLVSALLEKAMHPVSSEKRPADKKEAPKRPADTNAFKTAVEGSLLTILQTSTALSSPFIGSILRIIHDVPELSGFDAASISNSADGSMNHSLGILILESIIKGTAADSHRVKRSRTSAGPIERAREPWIELAKIYKSVDDLDAFRSIYEDHVCMGQGTKDAIAAQSLRDWLCARDLFDSVLTEAAGDNMDAANFDKRELDLCARGRLECASKLGQWDVLAPWIWSDLENKLDNLWDHSQPKEPQLGLFLRTFLRLKDGVPADPEGSILMGWTKDEPNPLFSLVNDPKLSEARRAILESSYPIELALASLLGPDLTFSRARQYVESAQEKFLGDFANLNPLVRSKMGALQAITELTEFLDLAEDSKKLSQSGFAAKLLGSWADRYPSFELDSTDVWDEIVFNRDVMLDKLSALVPPDAFEIHGQVAAEKAKYCFAISEADRKQKSFVVADHWLNTQRPEDNDFEPNYHYAASQLNLARLLTSSEPEQQARYVSNPIGGLFYYKVHRDAAGALFDFNFRAFGSRKWAQIEAMDPAMRSSFYSLESDICEMTADILLNSPVKDELSGLLIKNKWIRQVSKSSGFGRPATREDLLRFFVSKGFMRLNDAIAADE